MNTAFYIPIFFNAIFAALLLWRERELRDTKTAYAQLDDLLEKTRNMNMELLGELGGRLVRNERPNP